MHGRFNRKIILDNGQEIEYILDCKKRKNMYICIDEGVLVVKISPSVSIDQAEEFIHKKSDWIIKHLNNKRASFTFPEAYNDKDKIFILGQEFEICLIDSGKYFKPKFENGKLIIAINKQSQEKDIKIQGDKAIVSMAEEIIGDSMNRMTKLTGLYPNKVTIKFLKSSWGRCSTTKNISININVIFYDVKCIDYVIIHELCHLKHMNHSKDFWNLVEKFCPDWKETRNILRG